ncbi:MAG: hypothetical protein D6693_10130 [Planctomycetota bacterium]|nr:MAG: hypothetical protein D6693_10130 [Planctomycetota bacterium]
MLRATADTIPNQPADGAVPLPSAPLGRAVRLVGLDGAGPEAETLGAMGVREGEIVYVHKIGEPTIVSVGAMQSRRIGLSRAACRGLSVVLDG